jgi:hypothetical protein
LRNFFTSSSVGSNANRFLSGEGPDRNFTSDNLFNDGILNDFGLRHFDLGVVPYPKNPSYVDRTGPLDAYDPSAKIAIKIGGWPPLRDL